MKVAAHVFWLLGIALVIALAGYAGFRDVGSRLWLSGWGLVWVTLYHLLPLLVFTWSWSALLEPSARPSFSKLLFLRWISESVNGLLPVGHVGGDFVRARFAARSGLDPAEAGASVTADVTAGFLSEVVFAFVGVGLLAARSEANGATGKLLAGVGLFALLIAALFFFQRRGLFTKAASLCVRATRGRCRPLLARAAALDAALEATYRRRSRFLACFAGRLAGWFLGAGEVWLGLRALGHPVSILDAATLESLSQAARSAAFVLPGGLGAQEAGLMAIGSALGIDSGLALALSLLKRARELILGVPGLVAWQVLEGRSLWRRPSVVDPATAGPARRR